MTGPLDSFAISLDVIGDDVEPDNISAILGAQPTESHRKGEAIYGSDGKDRRNAKSGRWTLRKTSRDYEEPDFDTALRDLLQSLTSDLAVWRDLSQRFDTGLFCGLFMGDTNEGLTLSPDVMAALGSRTLRLDFDVYGPELPQKF